jgi:hypothetical protein
METKQPTVVIVKAMKARSKEFSLRLIADRVNRTRFHHTGFLRRFL